MAFQFCSGAGGWSTDFEIEKDGSFKGNYHDSDMETPGMTMRMERCISAAFRKIY